MYNIDQKQAIDQLVRWYESNPDRFARQRAAIRFEELDGAGWFDAGGDLLERVLDWYREYPTLEERQADLDRSLRCYDEPALCRNERWRAELLAMSEAERQTEKHARRERELGYRPAQQAERETAEWQERHLSRPVLSAEMLESLEDLFKAHPDDPGYFIGPDFGSRTQLIEDRDHAPFSGGNAESFAHDYARTLPLGWRDSIVVCLTPGEPIVVVRWTAERVKIDVTRTWAEHQGRHTEDGNWRSRWRVIEYWDVPPTCICVAIPPAAPVRAGDIRDMVARVPEQPNAIAPTGLAPLDRALRGGVPLAGARCVIQGPTGNCKTTMLLEIAANLAASGRGVVWIATRDELPASICTRWHQRQGAAREEAMRMTTSGLLSENLYVVDGREYFLEDILAVGGFDVLMIDTLQKVRTRTGTEGGQLGGIAAALEMIESSGITTWMASALTRGSERRPALASSFGGAGVENGATLLIDVRRQGDALAVEVLKSRYGGEGEKFELVVVRERQRITEPRGADGAGRIWADVRAALAGGPLTKQGIEHEVTGKNAAIRQVVTTRLATGELVERDGGIALP